MKKSMQSKPINSWQAGIKIGDKYRFTENSVNIVSWNDDFAEVRHGSTIFKHNLFIVTGFIENHIIMLYVDQNDNQVQLAYDRNTFQSQFEPESFNSIPYSLVTLEDYRKHIGEACDKWKKIINDEILEQLALYGVCLIPNTFILRMYKDANANQSEILNGLFGDINNIHVNPELSPRITIIDDKGNEYFITDNLGCIDIKNGEKVNIPSFYKIKED